MTTRLLVAIASFVVVCASWLNPRAFVRSIGSAHPPSADTLALTHVNVIPMDRERILDDQTIVVAGGRIVALGPAKTVSIPASATRVDGDGRVYVLPGLADMHVHLRYASDLQLLLANGVTTVRNMRGEPFHLEWWRRIDSGELLGPQIVTAGLVLRGEARSGATPEAARALVDSQAAAGYDFIKVYNGLPKASYEAVIRAAADHNMPVAGHVPMEVGVLGVLAAGQSSIEHAEQISDHHFGRVRDSTQLPALSRRIAAANVYVTPTLATIRQLQLQWENPASVFASPEIRFVPPETYAWWRTDRGHNSTENRAMEPFLKQMIRGFRDNEVRMLAGTDYYLFGLTPGFGLHRELAALVDAGLTPYQALETATSNPARYLRDTTNNGTIAIGKAANLFVIAANPLTDIRALSQRFGVVVRGRWLPVAMLDRWLDSLAASYSPADSAIDRMLTPGEGARLHQRPVTLPSFDGDRETDRSTLALIMDGLLSAKRFEDAVGVGEALAKRHPVASSFVRLGDAYAGAAMKDSAIGAYEAALAHGAMMVTQIQDKIKKLRTPGDGAPR